MKNGIRSLAMLAILAALGQFASSQASADIIKHKTNKKQCFAISLGRDLGAYKMTAFGASWNYKTPEAAQKAAMKECLKHKSICYGSFFNGTEEGTCYEEPNKCTALLRYNFNNELDLRSVKNNKADIQLALRHKFMPRYPGEEIPAAKLLLLFCDRVIYETR